MRILKKKVQGKKKGNSFERKVANLLSSRFEEFLGVKTGFMRNPSSGSYFGGSNQSRILTHSLDFAVFGDLICPRNFKFSIECKHYKSPPSWQGFLDQNIAQWDDWLSQATQDAKNSSKSMALIVKYNNVSEIVFLDHTLEKTETISNQKLDIPPVFTYKGYVAYKLETFLSLENSFYFIMEKL